MLNKTHVTEKNVCFSSAGKNDEVCSSIRASVSPPDIKLPPLSVVRGIFSSSNSKNKFSYDCGNPQLPLIRPQAPHVGETIISML